MAAPEINWREQAGPLKIFKGNRRKIGERKRGIEKQKREAWPGRHHPATCVYETETLILTQANPV